MTHLTADVIMADLLRLANAKVEIRDPKGEVLGVFTPTPKQPPQQPKNVPDRFDPIEIDRRIQFGAKGYTTREVFIYLQSLTEDPVLRADLQEKINGLAEDRACDVP